MPRCCPPTPARSSGWTGRLHAVNTTLADAGFGPALLRTVIGFTNTSHDRRLGLVYLFKLGTIYPFAPTGPNRRDTALELQIRAELGTDIPIEADLARWFPIWDAPGALTRLGRYDPDR